MCGAEGAAAQIRPEESVCVFILQAVRTPSKEIPVSVCVCNSSPALDPSLSPCVCVCVSVCVYFSWHWASDECKLLSGQMPTHCQHQ